MLRRAGTGFGLVGLASLLAEARQSEPGPLHPKPAHHPARARRVIFLYMAGGPAHVDLFDPKPRLASDSGKPIPHAALGLTRVVPGKLLGSPWTFRRHGESGVEMSELLPHLARCADDLCVVRSGVADNISHPGAYRQLHTGEQTFSRPSLGSWLLYGLGSENRNLPGFVVIAPTDTQGAMGWSASFLPAAFQGTHVSDLARPVANLAGAGEGGADRRSLDLLRRLNERHALARPEDSALEARIESFELASRMQAEAPDAFDLGREPESAKRLYGLHRKETETFGKQCLLARRLVERGVRVVEVYSPVNWDHHEKIRTNLPANCAATDLPAAALLRDLKARGWF
jgi:hypothetical protein